MSSTPTKRSATVIKTGYAQSAALISIITVTFNDPEGLRSTIKSLMESGPGNFELVIVEGADPVDATAESVLLEILPDFPITVVQGRDGGPYDAMNRGIIASSGDWIWFMNSGDLFGPEVSMVQIENLLRNSNSSWLVGRARVGQGSTARLKGFSSTADLLSGKYTPCHQSIIVRRDAFLIHGLFDTRFRISADYDLMCKLGQIGDPLLTSVVLTHYLGGGISDTRVIRREFESATIRLRGVRKISLVPKECLRFLVRVVRAVKS
ncbi:glycosyltransferase [Rhodococcus opacus]|uniref:glycosyltransferase n=1 Tax=Rhodococcus opacus TaxID=37919 RepID=UPI000EA91603|nr:glycosyltransferase [Rhodococcus opacus]QZS54687.1 glycosyltransferase [Rhodococcus opacus]RKM72234.1 hypothetical protein COO55_09320 [Rhodococcus opacus]